MSVGKKRQRPDYRTKARIDSAVLAGHLEKLGETVPQFAKRIRVSNESVYKWTGERKMKNPYVSHKKLIELSSALGIEANALVYYGDGALLDEAAFYEQIRYGWFVDNPRSSHEHTIWLCEEVLLVRTPGCPASGPRLAFTGTFTNCIDETYEIEAERLTRHLFVAKGLGNHVTRCFVGVVNHYIRYPLPGRQDFATILCGIWSGINLHGDQAVYRWLLSSDPLSQSDLHTIGDRAIIRSYFNSASFHSDIRPETI